MPALSDEEARQYWEDLEARVAASGIQRPRSDRTHPEYQKYIEGKLPLYGDAPAKEDAQEASQKPPKRSRDTKLTTAPKATRKRDTKLPRRKAQGTPG